MAKTTGEAAPQAPAEEMEVGSEMMGEAVRHLGIQMPSALTEETEESDETTETEETEETTAAESDETDDTETEETDDESDTEETEDDEEETAEAADDEESEDAGTVDLKKLPREVRATVQGILDKRIAKITAKAKAETETAQARVTQLESDLAEAREKGGGQKVVVPAGVHPLFLAESEADLDKRLEQIEAFEDWADTHAAGVNLEDSESYDPQQPTYTPEQIRARLREVRREKEKVLPAARANLQKRGEFDVALRKLAPTLFDAKHEDHASINTIAKNLPELKRFPDWKVIAYQQVLGRKALAELLKQKEAPKKKGELPTPKKKAPRVPGSGGPAKGGVAERKSGKPDSSEAVKTFTKAPTRENLLKAATALLD